MNLIFYSLKKYCAAKIFSVFLFIKIYGAKFVKCTHLKTFCLRFPWKSAKLLSWWTSFNSPKRMSLVRRVVSISGLEFSTFYREGWYSINHNFYTSYPNWFFKTYFLPNISKRKNNRRIYLRKRFCRTTLISYLTYFGEKNRIFSILKIRT